MPRLEQYHDMSMDIKTEIKDIQQKLAALKHEKIKLEAQLLFLEKQQASQASTANHSKKFSQEDKIRIFRSLFRGREDVYPLRWENTKTEKSGYAIACGNDWVKGLCQKPKIKCSDCTHQNFLAVTDDIIRFHLTGRDATQRPFTAGVYPLLPDETCWFLAIDFDKDEWKEDVRAFLQTCQETKIPAYIERSRSGNGAHIWFFFSQPVSAADARKLGSYLLTLTMDQHPDMKFSSYDRLFPNQDTMPKGGFGNLIALPLQYGPRQNKNSVFLDNNFEPYEDQWAMLSTIQRITPETLHHIISEALNRDLVTGVRMPLDEEGSDKPWKLSPSRKSKPSLVINEPLPKNIRIVQGNQLYISKKDLPPTLINKIIRVAAFQNPEFYRAQAMRLSTFDKPRIIACAENFPDHIGLPRGCLDEIQELFSDLNIDIDIQDERYKGTGIDTKFVGELSKEQRQATNSLVQHDIGILSATTGFGKTVLAANIIAKRKRNTLILVHRRQLLDQWIERLQTFLDIKNIAIGYIGGGKRKPSGQIDIALIQSLVRKGTVNDIVADYGQLIVDECHHLSAVSFEAVARQCKAKYVLGLTATPTRKDGQHPIIFMQCGPIRHHVSAKSQAIKRSFKHIVVPRYTEFQMINIIEQPPIQTIYQHLTENDQRNNLIFDDMLKSLEEGRSPILLTERKEQLAYFAKRLERFAKNVIVLQGGMGAKQYKEITKKLKAIEDDEERIIIATGRYIGEGFDDARLDTLFLAMPVSWKGTLSQYVGRLHRNYHNKTEVRIYDYIDYRVPMLMRMSEKRMTGYRSLGYDITAKRAQKTSK